MRTSSRTPDPHILLLHDAFLRRLAGSLVAQRADADDLVQATYERALNAGAREDKPVGAWLRVIAQRLAWRRGSREGSRRRRESYARLPESAPTPQDVIEREEMRRHVIRAVLDLPANDREVLVLRYLEDLSLREVGTILRLPTETVRTRQKRALARLRAKLEQEHPASLGALLLLGPPWGGGTVLPLLGGLAVKKVLAVCVVLVLLVGIVALSLEEAAETVAPDRGEVAAGQPQLTGRAAGGDGSAGHVATETTPREAGPTESVPAELSIVVRNRVTGFPVAGAFARIPTPTGPATMRSDAEGRIRIRLPRPVAGRLPAELGARGYVGVRLTFEIGAADVPEVHEVGLLPIGSLRDFRVLTGVVVDAHGRPVEGAVVWSADMSWWTYETRLASATTDLEGRFELRYPREGGGRGHGLRAHHPIEGDGADTATYKHDVIPFIGHEPIAARRAVDMQRGIRIVLRPPRGLLIAIEGSARQKAQAYALEIRPADSRFDAALAPPHTASVHHGDEVRLGYGKWALLLRSADGHHLVAAPLHVEADASGVARTTPRPTSGWDDATWTRGEDLAELPFTVRDRRVRVRVLADGAPVKGARLRIEPAEGTDPYLVRYGERDSPGGILGSGLLGDYQPGRRRRAVFARTGVTGEDGVVTFTGWIPKPAMAWVRGAHVVDHFEQVTAWTEAPAAHDLDVEIGGTLDIRLPDWIDRGLSLRDLSSGELVYLRASDLPITLPSGRYLPRMRQWSENGRTSADRPLDDVVDVRAGAAHVLDLRDAPPPLALVLRLRPSHAHGTVRIRQRGRCPPRDIAFDEGVARWEQVTYGRSQLVLAWSERSGATHEHRVMLTGLPRADETTTVVEYDLGYPSGSVELEIESHADREMMLVLGGSDLAAAYDYGHSVHVVLPPGETTRTTVHDLPAGSYRVFVGDDEHLSDRDRVEVEAGQTAEFHAVYRPQVLHLDLTPADPALAVEALEGGCVYLKGPREAPETGGRLRTHVAPIRIGGVCVFEKLPAGSYDASACWPGDTWRRGMHFGLHEVEVGNLDVARGRTRRALKIPTRILPDPRLGAQDDADDRVR